MADSTELEVLGRVSNAPTLFVFWCPGCEYGHHLETGPNGWSWNGDMVKPTATPSLKINPGKAKEVPLCHFFIRNGQFQFCGDTTHALKGQTVDMVPWKDAGLDGT